MGAIADLIRSKVYGKDMRESIAKGVELTEQIIQDYNAQVINAGSSNSEIVDARGGKVNLKTRLDGVDTILADYLQHLNLIDLKTGLVVSVKEFGAKGDGTDETTFVQNAINSMTLKGVLFFPPTTQFYNVSTLTIPDGKHYMKIVGGGRTQTRINFSGLIGFNVQSEGVYFEHIMLTGPGLMTAGTRMFKDTRPNNRADFDIDIQHCYVQEVETVVESRGRGINIENCVFYSIRYNIMKPDFPDSSVFEPSPDNGGLLTSGFRGFVFRNNRVHYSPCMILSNTGANKLNLSGVSIEGNHLEGSTGYIEGYVRNGSVLGNIHYQCGSVRNALFMLNGCDNLNIGVTISGKQIAYETVSEYCNRLLDSDGPCNNLTVKANIQDIGKDIIYLNGGGKNINIDVNAKNIGLLDTSAYGVIKMDGAANTYNSIKISGTVDSPSVNFCPIRRNGNLVDNVIIDLMVNGTFASYDNLDSSKEIRRPVCNAVYSGDGTTNRAFTPVLKYAPKMVKIFAVGYTGIKHKSSSALTTEITLTSTGFTATGTANTNGTIYAYEVS